MTVQQVQGTPARRASLLAWRDGLLGAGIAADQAPLTSDLETIARLPEVDRARLEQLSLVRKPAVLKFAPGILSTLRQAALDPSPTADVPAPAEAVPPFGGILPASTRTLPAADAVPVPLGPPAPTPPPAQPPRATAEANAATSPSSTRPAAAPTPAAAPAPQPATFALYEASGEAQEALYFPAVTLQADGSLRIVWSPVTSGARTVLYRVVTSDDWPPSSPDGGFPVAVTGSTQAIDPRPLTGALRYVQVWANQGADDRSARAAQPVLHAAGVTVAPPSDVVVREDHGSVMGSWRVAADVRRVEVARLSFEQARTAGWESEDDLLELGGSARTGFYDSTCVAGREYVYRVYGVVEAQGSLHRSSPVEVRVGVPALLTPLRDLQAVVRQDGPRPVVDLAWPRHEQGEVRLYRSARAPAAGASDKSLSVSALPQAGLAEQDRLPPALVSRDGGGHLSGVAWPEDWAQVHFTPVTVSGGTARVGTCQTLARTSSISDALVVQRVTWQLLTFTWPDGAAEVQVLTSATGAAMETRTRPVARLDKATYEAQGGVRLDLRAQWHGCDLHLVPVSFYGGRPVPGASRRLTYPGLLRVAYDIVASPGELVRQGWRRVRLPPVRSVTVTGDQPVPPADMTLDLVLVHHGQRLPLGPQDGAVVSRWQGQPVPPSGVHQVLGPVPPTPPGAGGFLRLFLQSRPSGDLPVALLDPRDLARLRP